MKIKHYKFISSLLAGLLYAFTLPTIGNYFIQFNKNLQINSISFIIAQGLLVLGLVCLIFFFVIILDNINKQGVFVRKNEITLRYFGLAIFLLGLLSDIVFINFTDFDSAGSRILIALGITVLFISLIFKIGIKIQEEQELTI